MLIRDAPNGLGAMYAHGNGVRDAFLGQTTEKKAVSPSIINVIAIASYIYTPYLYSKSDGPKYVLAMGASSGFAFATFTSAWVFRMWLQRANHKIGRSGGETRVLYAY